MGGEENNMNGKLIKIDKNGSKHIRVIEECDRCQGRGYYAIGVLNGELVYAHPDAGVCYKCHGAGKVERTIIERTPEYQAKLDARRAKRQAKIDAQLEAERAERERKAEEERAERERIEAEIAAKKARSQYVGTEGEKITIEADLEAVIRYKVAGPFGQPETRLLYKFRDSDGNALAWHTSSGRYIELEGERVTVTATIKRHSEYRGEKQTELLRCKIEKLG